MSEFMVIAPQDWMQVDFDYLMNNTSLDINTTKNLILQGLLYEIESVLKNEGMMDANFTLVEAKVIDDTQLWIKIG